MKIIAVKVFQLKQLKRRNPKKFRLEWESNPWPLRYRCSTLTNGAIKPTGSWSIVSSYIEQLPVGLIAQLVRELHRYLRGHGFDSHSSLNFFRFLLFNCLSWNTFTAMIFIKFYLYPQFKYVIISYINVHFTLSVCPIYFCLWNIFNFLLLVMLWHREGISGPVPSAVQTDGSLCWLWQSLHHWFRYIAPLYF